MRIERVDLIRLKMPIVGHFETSYGRRYDSEKLLLKFYTADFETYTECVAGTALGYSYESIGTAREVLKTHLLPAVMGRELTGPDDFWRLCGRFRGHPMAKAAIENALWILTAMEKNISLAKLLGNEKDRVTAGVSIGIQDSSQELVDLATQYLEQGYPRLKMKIKPGADVKRVEAMRKALPDVPLMVDANNAYSLDDLDIIRALDGFNLIMIEQPLAYDDIMDHAKLQPS